jgi:hypothetical protein
MRAFILSMLVSLGFLAISARAVRRGRLREQAAVLWLLVGCAMVFMSATLPFHLLNHVAALVGIAYPPDLLLVAAIVFLVVLVFQLSISLARLSEKHRALVQEFGIVMARSAPSRSPFAGGAGTRSEPGMEMGQDDGGLPPT